MKKTALVLAAAIALSSTAALAQVASGPVTSGEVESGPVASAGGIPAVSILGALVLIAGIVAISDSTTGTN